MLKMISALTVLVALCPLARAATKAADNAANAAYASDTEGAWRGLNPTANENPPGTDNGGFGFEAWDFSGGYHVPESSPYGRLNHFIDGVDFAASAFNDLGAPAFGLTNAQAPFGITASATRPFAAPMEVGDTLSFDFDSPANLDPFAFFEYPFAIISLRDAQGASTLMIEGGSSASFGDFNWSIKDGVNNALDTGIAPLATSDGSHMRFTLTAPTQGQLEFDGQLYDVVLRGGAPAAVRFTLTGNTSGDGVNNPTGEREFFFNNLLIESTVTVLAGDYNDNGLVDIADYTLWRDQLGAPAGILPNDVDGGTIGVNQYNTWKTNFGNAQSNQTLTGVAQVPEPAAWIVGTVAGLGAFTLRKRR